MNTGIMEATRLMREGRLAEATALIQRTLRGGSSAQCIRGPDQLIGAPHAHGTSRHRTGRRRPSALV